MATSFYDDEHLYQINQREADDYRQEVYLDDPDLEEDDYSEPENEDAFDPMGPDPEEDYE